MQYMGSKNRIAKELLPIILKDRRPGQHYVEPFVGGGNMIDKVDGLRIGADANPYVIQALALIRDDLAALPKDRSEFSESDYQWIKGSSNAALKGYAGFAFSFGAKWFGGWSRNKRNDDYVRRAYRNAQKQSPGLQGVHLTASDYRELQIPPNSIIYCDPPYAWTTAYMDKFNHETFWAWCKAMVYLGHSVFVSEYAAPPGWVSVWDKEIVSGLRRNPGAKKPSEKLFVWERY